MLRQKGLVQAAPAPRACATSTPSSSARQSFPSGWTPAVKDCFGLHGHSTFGSVAKEKIGVGGKSATSVGLTTDLVHWLQTCFRLPHCLGCIAACGFSRPPPPAGYRLSAATGHRAAVVVIRICRGGSADVEDGLQSKGQRLCCCPTAICIALLYGEKT